VATSRKDISVILKTFRTGEVIIEKLGRFALLRARIPRWDVVLLDDVLDFNVKYI
jgi:hypothetical protein